MTPLLVQDRYQLLRLVLINSASAAYIELPLNESAAILGGNNHGKTSLLNALKLFFLPEVNFKSCGSKFGFASQGKLYSGLQSFNYYFPSQTSFILLEATNARGDFCLVLHQNPSEELGYSRIAVPTAYENLRHFFWDDDPDYNQGAGRHPPDLNLAQIQKSLLRLKGVRLQDQESIRNSLYTRISLTKPELRFCLIPLVQQPTPSMIRAIKTLLQLSFDIRGSNQNNLPLAIANIIDSSLATDKQTANIDFKKIQTDRQRLRHDADHLNRVRTHRKEWLALTESHEEHRHILQKLKTNYQQISSSITTLHTLNQPLLLEAEQLSATLERNQNHERSVLGETRDDINRYQTEQNLLKKELAQLEQNLQRAEQALKENNENTDPNALAVLLRQQQREHEHKLNRLLSHEKMKQRLEELNLERSKNEKQIKELQYLQESGMKFSFLSALKPNTATVLHSLNPSFQQLKTSPSSLQILHLDDFANLFDLNGSELSFSGEKLANGAIQVFNKKARLEELKQQQTEAEQIRSSIEVEMQQLNNLLHSKSAQNLSFIKKEHEARIEKYKQTILALGSYDANKEKKGVALKRFNELEDKLTQLFQEQKERTATYDKLKTDLEKANERSKQLKNEVFLIEVAKKNLFSLRRLSDELSSLAVNDDNHVDSTTSAPLTAHELEPAQALLNQLFEQERQIKAEKMKWFHLLLKAQIIVADPELTHPIAVQPSVFWNAYQALHSQFDNLEDRVKEHSSQVRNHNHETSLEISLLEAMSNAIRNFADAINIELQTIKVSNLSGVRMVIHTLKGFNTLRQDLAAHGTTSDQLMNESFYNRLGDFCDKYLMDGHQQGKLDLEKIIEKVDFIYDFNGIEESVPQSNGTNSMINAVLLSLLLKRLVPKDIVLSIPVVFDEIGSLDETNLPELLRVVQSNHFQLLVANPNLTGYISAYIQRWHDLLLTSLIDAPPIGKCLAIYRAETESCLPIDPPSI